MSKIERKIKVGDTVRKLKTGLDDCSNHQIGDTFKVAQIYKDIWLRDEVEKCNGISSEYCELVEPAVNNNYQLY